MLNLLYVRFPNSFKGGVKSYSSMMIQILSTYAGEGVRVFDLSKYLEENHPGFDVNSVRDIKLLLVAPALRKLLQNVDLALADIGLLEHRELLFIYELKKNCAGIRTAITLHDPPLGPINTFCIFEAYQDLFLTKVIRKIYNAIIGERRAREMIYSADAIITLSNKGLIATRSDILALGKAQTKLFAFQPPSILQPHSPKKLIKNKRKSIILGYFGFITKAKGIHILLKAVKKIIRDGGNEEAAPQLLIAGRPNTKADFGYYNSLVEYVTKNELARNVHFLGYLADHDSIAFFESLDLLILPYRQTGSISASGPLTLARSFAVPIMASNTPFFVDNIVHGEDGLIFQVSDNGDDLLQKLTTFLSTEELRLRLLERSMQKAVDFSWDKSGSVFSNILMQI